MSFIIEAKAEALLALSEEMFDIAIFDGATDIDALRSIGFGRVLVPAADYTEARGAAVAHLREQGTILDGIYGAKHVALTNGASLWMVAYETHA